MNNNLITKGISLYQPKIEVWYDKKKVVVQTIEIVKDKEPTTHLYIAGIITEEQKE